MEQANDPLCLLFLPVSEWNVHFAEPNCFVLSDNSSAHFFHIFHIPKQYYRLNVLVSLFVFSPMSKLPVFDLSSHFLFSLFLFMKLYALTISIYFALCLTTLFWITVGFHSHTRWGNGEKIGHQRVTKGNRKHGFHPNSVDHGRWSWWKRIGIS